MSSSRFPGKPLIKLLDITMLEHVWRRTIMSDVDETYIALCDKETEEVCKKIGAKYVITSKKHQMCMDRIAEASDKKKSNIIVTVQGDEPLINLDDIRNLHKQMIISKSKLGTSASNISDKSLYSDPNVVKVYTNEILEISNFPEALNFVRDLKNVKGNIYKHIGIYCYQLETLKKFVSLHQSQNEIKNKLEQLRALDNKITINVSLAKDSPIGVDTEKDYVAIKKIMEYKSK